MSNRRLRFVHAQTGWMLATALVLALTESLSYELFFVVSLIGFLIVFELTEPFTLSPAWRRRLKWLVPPALLVFAYIVVRRILKVLPEGVI